MKTVVLISCVKKKVPYRAEAKDLYVSPFFKLNLRYARSLNPDAIFVLSAQHYLVGLEEELEPYERTLNRMPSERVKQWADSVLVQLSKVADLQNDRFVFLAGERYRKYLIPHLPNHEVPLQGLGIGKQMRFLKENTP